MHPESMVQHLGYIRSDHRPILLDIDNHAGAAQGRSGPRRFEAKWLCENNFRDVIHQPGMQLHMRYQQEMSWLA
jgi:hypothetical protein